MGWRWNGEPAIADTVPSQSHIPIPYVMGYDVRPLQTMEEKSVLLNQAVENDWILFFDHDPTVECASIKMTEKGFKVKDNGRLDAFLWFLFPKVK